MSQAHKTLMISPFQENIVELSEEDLNYDYVVENVFSNTDRFLENKISGSLKTWHLILIVTTGTMIASKSLIVLLN